MTLTDALLQPPEANHRKAQHPPFSTCCFDPWQLTVQSVTQEAAQLPTSRSGLQKKSDGDFCSASLESAPFRPVRCVRSPRKKHTTIAACKKIGGRFLFVTSRLRNLPPGQVRSVASQEAHHDSNLQKSRREIFVRRLSGPPHSVQSPRKKHTAPPVPRSVALHPPPSPAQRAGNHETSTSNTQGR